MRPQDRSGGSSLSLSGLAVGLAAGIAAGLLMAPMRGGALRATIRDRAAAGGARLQTLRSSGRDWAMHALDRSAAMIERGRQALETRTPDAVPLTASVGEIASMHDSGQPSNLGVTS